jgi:hypothetical protein
MKSLAIFQELGILAMGSRDADGQGPAGGCHVFHPHTALWDYCNPGLAKPFASRAQGPEVFASLPAGTTHQEAMARSRFLVFIGANRTLELESVLNRGEGTCLIFEPDLARLDTFLSGFKPRELINRGAFFVGGDPDSLDVPLLAMLPESLCDSGYPLFFVSQSMEDSRAHYVRRVEELIELFYYRNVIYSLESQDNIRGLPLRPMTRNAVYDRYKHLYENLEPCLHSGVLSDLTGALPGSTAILVAAGPALQESLDFIRQNNGRAVVIAVNSALKPLLAAGIEPHFVIINDTSMDSEPTLADLPRLEETRLVAHCLSTSGGGSFPKAYFFGNFPGQPFPKRTSLLLHGSVITTAFSLAEYLGCAKVLLAGVQLASQDPLALNYAQGSQHEGQASGMRRMEPINRWPQLYPVRAANGKQYFTTLNFFDSAQWFADRIRLASMEVINLCPATILTGPNISIDPAPALAEDPNMEARLAALPCSDFSGRRDRVLAYIAGEMGRWKNKQREVRQAANSLDSAVAFIAASDEDNTSFMLQRFEDFNNSHFHAAFFNARCDKERADGAVYFLERMSRMCTALLKILLEQHRRITAAPERS